MKLLLTGGGDPDQVIEMDKYFCNYVEDGKVLYIPVAMDKIPYNECENWFKKTYEKYGLKNIEMCTDLASKKILKEYKAVYIGGGNTFKLLELIKKSNFDIVLKEYLKSGGFVYGGSAGAIIFGKTIETAIHADLNYNKLEDLSGLNLLNECDIFCHYNPVKDESEIKNLNRKTYILYEESGLLFDGKCITKLGKEFLEFPSDFN